MSRSASAAKTAGACGVGGVGAVTAATGRSGVAPTASAGAAGSARRVDRAEFSPAARMIGALRDIPVREELVRNVRVQIKNNTYETPDKIEAALDEIDRDLSFVIEKRSRPSR